MISKNDLDELDEIEFLAAGGCACHRCLVAQSKPVEALEFDYCYVIAYHIDEDGNYHDDEGKFRDGQTHEVIQ